MQEKRYLQYSRVLKEKYGCKVYKVTLDARFSCPNRDGSKGVGGCTFCDETGTSSRAQDKRDPIATQVCQNVEKMRKRFHADKFIAYFQSFTNTYRPVERLKKLYDEAINAHPDVIGLAISTRPDCVDENKLDLIASYQRPDGYLCVEYGMQTIHNETLQRINRCETHEDFLGAFEMTRQRGIPMCIHVILGLPGETRQMMMETADVLSRLKPEGVKIHLLCAMKNTPLAQEFHQGLWTPLEQKEYVSLVCDFIERLDPSIAIHRITGNGHVEGLVAPQWLKKKHEVLNQVDQELYRRGTRQGSKCLASPVG